MKQAFLTLALALATIAATAQTAKQETTYRRSSLYTIMMPDDKLTGEIKDIVEKTFIEKAFPDKYNNHNLSERVLDLAMIKATPVTDAEVAAVEKMGVKKLGGWGRFGKEMLKDLASDPTKKSANDTIIDDSHYVAKILKHLVANHVAGRMVAKWFGGPDKAPAKAKPISTALIEERGLNTLSTEEKAKAEGLVGGKERMVAAAEYDLMGRTFIMVNRYSYVSADEIKENLDNNSKSNDHTFSQVFFFLKGYFVKTTSYLFQLDLSKNAIDSLATKYASDIRGLYTDDGIKLKYCGKTTNQAPTTMKITVADDADKYLIARATVRATDGAIAKLQKAYDQFKTLATLHQDGENLFAYVGKKEGCKEGTKFEVLQRVLNDDGTEGFDVVGKVQIQKGQLWDNRMGAGEKVKGETEEKGDKDAGNASLGHSGLGTSKKMLEGSLLRQVK